jgi:hypothetical protein
MGKGPELEKLSSANYNDWSVEMEAWLRAQGVWNIVAGISTIPSDSDKREEWEMKASKASGWIVLYVDKSQRVHLDGIRDDPVKMWKKLKSIHQKQKAGSRFNAYDDLFNIRKADDESLLSLATRMDEAMIKIKNLHPAEEYTLEKLDEELLSMAMLRSLPEDYKSLVSTLLLNDKLDRDTVIQAFHTEEIQRTRRSSPDVLESANKAGTFRKPEKRSGPPYPPCFFCGKMGHSMKKCHQFLASKQQAQANVTNTIESAGKASIYSSNVESLFP